MRCGTLALVLTTVSLTACDDDDDWRRYHSDSAILFAIRQTTDATTRKTITTSGYEYLEIGGRGWSQVRSREDDECFFEDTSLRLGRTHVEGGIARFIGGKLPAGGIALVANQDGPTVEGPGWDTGALLTFDVDGFALPPIRTIAFPAPAAALDVAAPEEGELALQRGADLDVAWAPLPANDKGSSVLVALEADDGDGRGRTVSCFFKKQTSAKVPGPLIRRLAKTEGAEVKGTLVIATHTQATIRAKGGWTVYAVATTQHREQPFVLR